MEDLLEICWHGRGGQGAVTAAKVLAEAVITEGKYAQAFPEFGPERRGAPVRAFNRISSSFFRGFYGVATPSLIIVLDEGLLKTVDVTKGLLAGGTIIINTSWHRAVLEVEEAEIFGVNAFHIARECTGRPTPNTPMLGALARVKPIVGLQTLSRVVEHSLGFAMTQEGINANIDALRRGYEEVTKI